MKDVDPLTADERKALLDLARASIEHSLGVRHSEPSLEPKGGLARRAGAFVSLHAHGDLRGCIGTFATDDLVGNQVREMAKAAAMRDPRFPPVSDGELADIDVEISVLSEPRPVADPSEVTVGKHGVLISRGYRRGVLLPQVATEHGWDRETFLRHTCLKAGLPPDAWEDPETRIEVFTAEVFGER